MKRDINKKSVLMIVGLCGIATLAPVGALAAELVISNNNVEALEAKVSNSDSTIRGNREVRFATYNLSFDRANEGDLEKELANDASLPQQVKNVAEIIQRNNPDVILLNEFNYDEESSSVKSFQKILREQSFNGSKVIDYPYYFTAPSNTGIHPTPLADLDGNGTVTDSGGDAFGFGNFPGQYGMAVLSKYPIKLSDVRTFQKFLWKDMPDALLPDNAATPKPNDYYSEEVKNVFRLSSKSHWDLPIQVGDEVVHFLVSHPTPPTFDGPEDRNGARNHDEIRFWADYIDPAKSSYIYDDTQVGKDLDQRTKGGLKEGDKFVIAGDNNADPKDGDSLDNAALQFLNSPYINTSKTPERTGEIDDTNNGGATGSSHAGSQLYDTSIFVGNLRVDYVLPSANMEIVDAKVFWPNEKEALGRLVVDGTKTGKEVSSDHRLVYVTVKI